MLLVLLYTDVKSQIAFFDLLGTNKIKVFYDYSGDVTIEQYADYNRIAYIDAEGLYFDGEFSDFDSRGRMILTGTFKGGKLDGLCKYFFPTGNIKETGIYNNGIRDSIWNFYYQNGQVEKTISFNKGTPYVLSLFNKKGQQIIINGNGMYLSEYYMIDNGKQKKHKICGELKNGKFDGKWSISDVTTENFKNGDFISGYDVILYTSPQQIQLTNLLGFNCQEKVDLFQNNFFCTSCINDVSWAAYSVKGNINKDSYNILLSQFSKLLDSLNISNYVQILEFEVYTDGSIKNIKSLCTDNLLDQRTVKKMLNSVRWFPLECDAKSDGYIYMMMIKNDNKLYLPQPIVITNDKEANFMLKCMTQNNLLICQ